MQTWIMILRKWPLYARRREAAGVTAYSGASYARSLIQDGSDETGTNPRPSGNHSAHGRLKDAVARATRLQGLYDTLCSKTGGDLAEKPTPVLRTQTVKPTVRLPFAELYHADCLGGMS